MMRTRTSLLQTCHDPIGRGKQSLVEHWCIRGGSVASCFQVKRHLDKGSGNEVTQHELVFIIKWAQWIDDHIWPESGQVAVSWTGTTAAIHACPRLARDDVKLDAGDGDATSLMTALSGWEYTVA